MPTEAYEKPRRLIISSLCGRAFSAFRPWNSLPWADSRRSALPPFVPELPLPPGAPVFLEVIKREVSILMPGWSVSSRTTYSERPISCQVTRFVGSCGTASWSTDLRPKSFIVRFADYNRGFADSRDTLCPVRAGSELPALTNIASTRVDEGRLRGPCMGSGTACFPLLILPLNSTSVSFCRLLSSTQKVPCWEGGCWFVILALTLPRDLPLKSTP